MRPNVLFDVRHHATPSQEHDFAITVLAERHMMTPPGGYTKESWSERCHELNRQAIIDKMKKIEEGKNEMF